MRYYRERGPGSGTYITYLHNTDNVVELDTVPLILMEHGSLYTEVYVIISTPHLARTSPNANEISHSVFLHI